MIVINRRFVRMLLFSVLLVLISAYLIGPHVGVDSLFKLDEQGIVAVWFESGLHFLAAMLMLFLSLSAEAEITK